MFILSPSNNTFNATFDSLNDDTIGHILKFVGPKAFLSVASMSKRCQSIYLFSSSSNNNIDNKKETYFCGYAPLKPIVMKYFSSNYSSNLNFLSISDFDTLAISIVCYNRLDILRFILMTKIFLKEEEKGEESASSPSSSSTIQDWNLLTHICKLACKTGSLRILREIFSFDAAKNNIMTEENEEEIVEYLFTRGALFAHAARYGHLKIIQYLKLEVLQAQESSSSHRATKKKYKCDWNKYTCTSSARGGFLDVLIWCRQNGCEWDMNAVCRESARGGHLHIIEYVYEQHNDQVRIENSLSRRHQESCVWDLDAHVAAASKGHLNVLKYLQQKEQQNYNYHSTSSLT